jgi:hypothetical protein
MKVAFHFLAESYGSSYGPPIKQLVFGSLLALDLGQVDTEVRVGDLLVHSASRRSEIERDPSGRVVLERLYRDDERRASFIEALKSNHLPTWRSISLEDLELAAENTRTYVIVFEELSLSVVETLDRRFKDDTGYLGALQVYPSNTVHWLLYDQYLILEYRLVGRVLRLLHHEFEGEDGRPELDQWMRDLSFDSIELEDLDVRETPFDPGYWSPPPADPLDLDPG